MKVALVGHGPSLLQEPMGDVIDDHDVVVRLKRCHNTLQHPEHYGTRTDVVGGSLTIAGDLRDLPASEFWIFLDSRHTNPDEALLALPRLFDPRPVKVDEKLCRDWDSRYCARRTATDFPAQQAPSRYGDELGEKHLSQGFKALLYAASLLEPDKITLCGFDSVMTGDFYWSVTRGPDWNQYPQHRWDVEHEMLQDVEKEFCTSIGFLLPTEGGAEDEK